MSARIEGPSSNSNLQYSFEVAELYLPEERKAYCVLRIKEVEYLSKQMKTLLNAEPDDTLKPSSLFPKFGELIQGIKYPVNAELLDTVNEQAPADNRRILDWNKVRKMYGVINESELGDAITGFEENPLKNDIQQELIKVLEETGRGLEEMLEKLGGDSDKNLKEILEVYDPDIDSDWHAKLFGVIEKELYVDIINTIRKRLGITASDIETDDLGCGTGRCMTQLVELFQEGFEDKFDPKSLEEMLAFLKKYHAIDISRNKARKTRNKVAIVFDDANQTYNETNIEVGDFHEDEPHGDSRVSENSIHMLICMMRTIQYNITQDKTVKFLRKIAKELIAGNNERAGGMALVDTVGVIQVHNPSKEDEANLEDLKHFYPQLIFKYVRDNKDNVPDDIDLNRMSRLSLYDNTTKKGFYQREVPTEECYNYFIAKEGLDLRVVRRKTSTSPLLKEMMKNPVMKKWATKMGREWLKDNELEDYYRKEITRRLEGSVISPELLKEIGYTDDIEVILDYLAFSMVSGFKSEYLVLERPMKKARDADKLAI